jgi:hypothetical protein
LKALSTVVDERPLTREERVDHYTLAVDYPLFLRERTG